MACVNLKKKTTVAVLCLLSFVSGCLLSSHLTSSRVLAREQGVQRRPAAPRLDKDVQDPLTRDRWRENATTPRHRVKGVDRPLDTYESHEEVALGRNETVVDGSVDDSGAVGKGQEVPAEVAVVVENRLTQPAPRFDYLAKVRDPRAEVMLQKVLSKLPTSLLRSVVKSGLLPGKLRPGPGGDPLPALRTPQDKWARLIATMQEQGYEQRLPTILNIGVKKSGTNAFGFFLGQHPQVVHSIGNEVHYFDWNYDKGIEYYRSRMGFSDNNQFSFEKTPRYFVTDSAPGNIKKDLPGETKFIICVRDPVERARSDFRHEAELALRRGQRDKQAVHSKAAKETPASQGRLFERTVLGPDGRVNTSNEIVMTSVYAQHFRRWLAAFPRDRFYILSDERFSKDIYEELRSIELFLGLEPYFKKSMFYYNPETRAPCMHAKPRPCPAKSTPGFLPKSEPSAEVIQKLRDFYRPFNQEFEKLTQMKFSWTHL